MRASRLVSELDSLYRGSRKRPLSVSVQAAAVPFFDLLAYAQKRGFMVSYGVPNAQVAHLGTGSYGSVYEVDASRAWKRYSHSTEAEQIKRELQMSRYLHPNVIQCFGVLVLDEPGLLMELGGVDMFDFMQRNNAPLDDDLLDALAFDLISATSYLHAQSPPIYHLDLKLENLLHCHVAGYGDVLKLADFGLSHCEAWEDDTKFGSQSPVPTCCGSYAYIPHGKLAMHADFLPHRDAWAIGCILFAMAYGCLLYKCPMDPHYNRMWAKIESHRPNTFAELFNGVTPRWIEEVLSKLLCQQPVPLSTLHPLFLSSLLEVRRSA